MIAPIKMRNSGTINRVYSRVLLCSSFLRRLKPAYTLVFHTIVLNKSGAKKRLK
jgi:hypothetical protein